MRKRELRTKIRKMHKEGRSYTEIGEQYDVSRQIIQKIAKYGIYPKDNATCVKLGIGRRRWNAWFELPTEIVLWALENREEFDEKS